MRTAREVIADLELEHLTGEGCWIGHVWRNDFGNAIYALLTPEDFSGLHRLKEDELWIHIDGDPIHMTLLHSDGRVDKVDFGRNEGMSLHALVPAGSWQGSVTLGQWSLVVCALAPAFTAFELATRTDDFSRWPIASSEIASLIHG